MEPNVQDILNKTNSMIRRTTHLSEPPDIIEETDDGAGTVTTYIGYAGFGTVTTSSASWLVIKIVETTVGLVVTTTKQYADSCLAKNKAWTGRAGFTYGYLPKQ